MTPTPKQTTTTRSGKEGTDGPEFILPSPYDDPLAFHAFLPSTFTPPTPSTSSEGLLTPFTSHLSSLIPQTKTLTSFIHWDNHQHNLDPLYTSKQLQDLAAGESLPIYIQGQNCGLIFTKENSNSTTISTFRLQLPAEKHSNRINHATVYPTYSFVLKNSDILRSESLIKQLSDLNNVDMQESVAKTRKQKTEVVEKREVAEPSYVNKWLLSVLANKDTRKSEFPRINKKIIDSVRFHNGQVIRRSALYVCIKITLNLLLSREFGVPLGSYIYKVVMISFLSDLVQYEDNIEARTLMEYLGKIGRRVYKLGLVDLVVPGWVDELKEGVFEETNRILKKAHEGIKLEVAKLQEESKMEVRLSDVKIWIQLTLRHNNFHELLSMSNEFRRFYQVSLQTQPIQIQGHRHRSNLHLFPGELLKTTPADLAILLYDFERNVTFWPHLNPSIPYIYKTTLIYFNKAKDHYRRDNIGYSRFILTLLKILKLTDSIVTTNYPLLFEHRSGVDLNLVKDLLLTTRQELEIIKKIEDYFTHREKSAKFPSLIEEDSPSVESFANRYASNDSRMLIVRTHILNFAKQQVQKKLVEVNAEREKCERLLSESRRLECSYIVDNWKRRHDAKCQKCRLVRQEKNMLVGIYESPLPVGQDNCRPLQNAVIFELLPPSDIAMLRDLLYLFKKEATGATESSLEFHGPWHEYWQIATCANRTEKYLVGLMSERKLFLDTHYRSLHPSNPNEDFIKVNGMNCVYASKTTYVTCQGQGLKPKTTFKVEKKSRYAAMQYGISGELNQNEVIARQNECHQDLGLTEFTTFGSLRSTNNLEWRNLYRALSSNNLSLKEESVYNLISQVIYCVGDKTDSYLRSNQLDFSSKEFCEEFLALVEVIRERHQDNWQDNTVLLTLINLTTAISHLNPSVESLSFKLLLKFRADTSRWSEEISRIIKSLTSAPRSEVDALRVKLVEINCCTALTFKVDEIYLHEIICDGGFSEWLSAIARIHDNQVLLGDNFFIKQSLRNLLTRVQELGVELEPFIKEAVRSKDLLTSFVARHHPGSSNWTLKTIPTWHALQNGEGQVYYLDIQPAKDYGQSSRVEMDIIKGKFLIDGCPVGYLPGSIEKHYDFQRVFGQKSFEVQPFAFQTGRMITKNKFKNSTYSFYLNNETLTITEHREGDIQLELIPEARFDKNIPDLLIDNYTHWFNFKLHCFEFHKKEEKLTSSPEYILQLDFERDRKPSWTLRSCKIKERVVTDVNSYGCEAVIGVISSLELPKYICIYCDRLDTHWSYLVDLPRLGLQFSIRNVAQDSHKSFKTKRRLGDLVSIQYRGMRISSEQNSLETLIGLRNALLLEDADINNNAKSPSILLVPHGRPLARNKLVFIDSSEVRNPPFFAYEIDTRLKQLKAGDSRAAWAYLALLHALTNQVIADPFTGVSGVERAMQILQSGMVFSSEPLDSETLKTFAQLRELGPSRSFYPPNSKLYEVSKSDFPLRTSYDSFYIIIEQLLGDSQRLNFLHENLPDIQESVRFRDEDLVWKHYLTHHMYSNELARLTPEFQLFETETIPYHEDTNIDENVQQLLALSQNLQNFTFTKPTKELLKTLLLNGRDLKGVMQGAQFPIQEALYTWARLDFRDYWLDLYNLARTIKTQQCQPEWAFLLTYFLFRSEGGGSFDQLNFLQTVAVNAEQFADINPPAYEEYSATNETNFDKESVKKILQMYKKPWESYCEKNIDKMACYEDELAFAARMRPEHEVLVNVEIDVIVEELFKQWPCETINLGLKDESEIDLKLAQEELALKIKSWYKNNQLLKFIEKVQLQVNQIKSQKNAKVDFRKLFKHRYELDNFTRREIIEIRFNSIERNFKSSDSDNLELAKRIFHTNVHNKKHVLKEETEIPPFPLVIDESDAILKDYMSDLKSSWSIYHREKKSEITNKTKKDRMEQLSNDLRMCSRLCLEYWEKIRETLIPRGKGSLSSTDQILLNSELFPRVIPLTMLKLILDTNPVEGFHTELRDLIGGYAVLLTKWQKASRCFRYARSQKDQMEMELQQELANSGHENWSPSNHPSWLLFEIESDLMIRPIQVKVAYKMMLAKEKTLIQLNMGEGKTLVIVPLLALALSDSEKLCRVTVLKSLFQINKTFINFRIGTLLLNRRVYNFPCRRDFKIGPPQAKLMTQIYEECKDLKGIVLTLPEYRLSFELKAYERCHSQAFEEARALFNLQEWIEENVLDILDESDEILQVKYQLIYTLGKQLTLEAGGFRWTVIQDILSVLPRELEKLESKHGKGFIEIKNRPNAFPYIRILKPEISNELTESIALIIIHHKTPIRLPNNLEFKELFRFLTKEQLSREELNNVLGKQTECTKELLLIIRGHLACNVLANCLTKRWRVQYGVNTQTTYRKMAVPFRAKDIASDRVEFGHPDVAILLTQLSYYYSGLTNEQLEHSFVLLNMETNPGQEYAKWVSLIEECEEKRRIKCLTSVNLNDFFQKTEILFPLLKYNRYLIDFYLGKVVYPHESKQFGFKIGCSPWDLTRCAVSGFSGTNDSKILLPSTVRQRDLEQLKGTNGAVLASLLKQNENYQVLEKVSAVNILKKLVESNFRVLLDVGALMLELNNDQVASKWLQLLLESNIEVDACIYFDKNDRLVVLDRSGTLTSFEISTFRNRLDRCVVYLDDVHTRGTDLKIPVGNTACVTLGKGVGKDKLVQGCMRMRKLGRGHSVVFWASPEVDLQIRNFHGQEQITTKEVLLWSILNNQEQIKQGFIHWASAGVYQAQKLSSYRIYSTSDQGEKDLGVLSEQCSQKEQTSLHAMYGDVRSIVSFPTIVDHLLKRVNRELRKTLKSKDSRGIQEIVACFGQSVVDHVGKYVGDLQRSTQLLDEEQERELEHELECQTQRQLPLRAKPLNPTTDPSVLRFIKTGSLDNIEKWTLKLPLALKNSSVWRHHPDDTWGKNIYVTKDFASVVKSEKTDDYLRPVEYFVSNQKQVVLLLSPYEAGLYIEQLRTNQSPCTLHMYSARISDWQEELEAKRSLNVPSKSISFSSDMKSALTLFSGGLYADEDYGIYLGYENGEFVSNEVFKESPEALIKSIIRLRWGFCGGLRESGVGKAVGWV